MENTFFALFAASALLIGMLACLEGGRRLGVWHLTWDPEGARAAGGPIDGAVFALLGLLVAFTFSGAATRFEARRELVVQEANDIGTAYLRLDLLSPTAQPPLRDLFRRYVDSRLQSYRLLPDVAAATKELAQSLALQGEIWTQAVAATRAEPDTRAAMLLLPALNNMIDIVTTRVAATKMHPPVMIYVLLFGLALGCSLLAGYGMASTRSLHWMHRVAFAAITTTTIFVILDIEYPRFGLIRVDSADVVLLDVRESMK